VSTLAAVLTCLIAPINTHTTGGTPYAGTKAVPTSPCGGHEVDRPARAPNCSRQVSSSGCGKGMPGPCYRGASRLRPAGVTLSYRNFVVDGAPDASVLEGTSVRIARRIGASPLRKIDGG
jgi:hypothetical protein